MNLFVPSLNICLFGGGDHLTYLTRPHTTAIHITFTNTDLPFFIYFTEFNVFPEMETVCGRTYLIHDDHRFSKRFSKNGRTYWRCTVFNRFKCRARVVSKKINGWEMANINCGAHSHPPYDFNPRRRAKTNFTSQK